jgi:hypothetical protein
MEKCSFCDKNFSSKTNLKQHQKTAKYCLNLQNVGISEFECAGCLKKYTTKNNLDRHKQNCNILYYKETISRLEKDLENKNKQIEILQDKIENIALKSILKPNIQHNYQNHNNQRINNIINNLIPITDEHLKQQAEFLTIDHIKNGIDGYVQYALDFPLKDRIICTDFSRRKIKYKDSEGNLVDDPEMTKVTQKLFKAIEEKNSILVDEYIKELQEKYNILIRNPNNDMNDEQMKDFDSTGNIILSETFKVNAQKREIKEVANGQKPEIYYEFIKDVCSKTVN